MDIDDFIKGLTCPRCGELHEHVQDSAYFEGMCCPPCDIAEQQRHKAMGCRDPECNCQRFRRMDTPVDIEDL